MILQSFYDRFAHMKACGNHIQYVLDIGAYRGDFSETIHAVWPSAIIRQFEADKRQAPWLDKSANFCLLGDQDNKIVDFYTLDDDKITTGSSIFKENTTHYNTNDVVVKQFSMITLDTLDQQKNFYGNWSKLGLVKIDTQGSELLILKGAKNFIQVRQPRYILLETSLVKYNHGAPLINESIDYMNNIGYIINDIMGLSYINNDLIQIDILFEKK